MSRLWWLAVSALLCGCRVQTAGPGECVGGVYQLNGPLGHESAPCLGGEARIETHGERVYAICTCVPRVDGGAP